uniref:Sulfhydryl oxidase n=1 Tax=Pyrodinium bahamense TaxID=73915 RepID=A0A7S0AI23_9DINO
MGAGGLLRWGSGHGDGARPRPPDRVDIGRAAWRYVHSMAAHYPKQPTACDKEDALLWLRAFVQLYPCGLCSREFVEVCSDLPPRLGSRGEYAMWWCEAHNRVRDDLSQPLYRCEMPKLLASGRAGGVIEA